MELPRRKRPTSYPPRWLRVSGDSLSYGSQPEYVHYVNPPPLSGMSGMGPYSWADSTSGTSQELYFRGHRKYFRRSFCSVCLSVAIVSVIIAVIGIVAIAAYLGVMTTDDSEAMKYEMQYSGKFRVARGDFFHPSLADTTSVDFQDKAERYQKMIETLYGYSYLSDAFRRASVERFGNDSLTVFFRVHLDRRKIPTSVLNTEEAVRDVVTQEVMSLEPRAFRAISIDIDSIEIKREQKDGASNAPFISRGGSRRQETDPSDAGPIADQPGRDGTSPSTAAPPPDQGRTDAATGTADSGKEVSAVDLPIEPATAEPVLESGARAKPAEVIEHNGGESSASEISTTTEKQTDSPADYEKSDLSDAMTETRQENDDSAGSESEPQSGPMAGKTEPGDVAEQISDGVKVESGVAEHEAQKTVEPAAETVQKAQPGSTETAADVMETGAGPDVGKPPTDVRAELESGPAVETTSSNQAQKNHAQTGDLFANHGPEHRNPESPSPSDISTIDPAMGDPAINDSRRKDADLLDTGASKDQANSYDDTTEDPYYENIPTLTTEGAILAELEDTPVSYEVIDQSSYYEPSAPISEEVATELAPFLAASVPQGVNRIGYVDLSAPSNSPTGERPAEPPSRDDFADIQVGTAYFGGLAPAPAPVPAPAPAPAPAPVWPQLGSSGPATAPSSDETPVGQNTWPQQQRPAPASQDPQKSPLYDYSPWNPIIPAFAQAVGQAGRPGSLFTDGGVRRGGDYQPAATVRPRPDLGQFSEQGYQASGDPAREEGTPPIEATTTRRPFVQVAQKQPSNAGPATTRPSYPSIQIPESVSIQQTLRILPREGQNGANLQKETTSGYRQPSPPTSSQTDFAPRPRPDSALPSRPRPRPSVRPPSHLNTEYHTEISTSELREESHVQPDSSELLEPPGGVNRLGIAFATRPATRRPLPAPRATTTQRIVVVNAAPTAGAGQAAGGVRPGPQPVASYPGGFRPIRPRPSAVSGVSPPLPDRQQNDGQSEGADGPGTVVVSPQPQSESAQSSQRPLPTGVSSVLAGALGGALSGAPDGPSPAGDLSAPSREQLLNLFRLIALRYPALVANMDQEQLQLLLNDEAARRKLLAPFLTTDKSRTPGEPQRTNTKLLELANISINGTRVDRREDGRALRREVAGGFPSRAPPPPPRRPFATRLSSSVLQALANFTRVKVAGGMPGSPRPRPALGTDSGLATNLTPARPQTGPKGSLSDRLHQLVGFPTRAPPRRGNGTAAGSSRGKLSHKLMRFHGQRTNADGACTDPTDFACRTLGGCVPAASRCDRLLDCADGSDERDCTCADRLRAQALHSKLCDGVVDCHDASDEKFCEWCRPDQFICPEAKHCVDRSALCDGKFDCADGADERHCVALERSAAAAEAGRAGYSSSGLLLVRKRGVWGRLCVDRLDGVVRQSRGGWGAEELGRAVCKALTYRDAKEVRPVGPNVTGSHTPATDEPFFKLLFSPNTVLPEAEKASLVFAEDTCPRQTALHVTCDQLQCGLRPRVKQRQARIVGGGNSSPGAWPWQAAMYRDGEYQCGATLIADRWLLSAGHCYLRSTSRFWVARLGAYRRGSSLRSPHERLHEVSHVIMHPQYQDVGYVHDIALLRLKEPVQMSDFVRPSCLPPPRDDRDDIQTGALCTVVGWGQLFESSKIFPDTLQEVEVPLISSQECKKRTIFLPLYRITDNMFCAGYERGGRDACLGDSGGPLMCQEPSGEWTLTGITSNGYGCARAGRPGVYTKVSSYARWIDEVTSGPLPPELRHNCGGYRCRLGRCLSQTEVCDGIVHCSDGSDEEHCTTPSFPTAGGRSQRS